MVFETKLSSFLIDRCRAKKIKQAKFCCILNVDREVLFIEVCLLSAFRRIFFHPAKFGNFKDEKISDFKTVSVSQRKKLAGLKTGGLVGL